MMTSLNAGTDKVFTRLHYPLDVMLTCVCWYVAYLLSLRNRFAWLVQEDRICRNRK